MQKNSYIWSYFLLSVAGVAYASLIPFQLKPIPLDEAWAQFESIPYLTLGPQSRADWIANILLYLPLGYFFTAWVDRGSDDSFPRGRSFCLIWSLCFLFAIGMEFLQVFFPPRTVSLNDIIAEGLGALLGMSLWRCFGEWGLRLWSRIRKGSEGALQAGFAFYGLIFLTYSLFPFDFIVSLTELSWKVSSGKWGGVLTAASRQGCLRTGLSLLLETCSVIPFGVYLLIKCLRGKPGVAAALIAGVGGGAILEIAQFFLVSGTSQGASVLAKTAGVSIGVFLPKYLSGRSFRWIRAKAPRMVLIASIPYIVAITYLKGWLTHPWIGIEMGWYKLNYPLAIPFYHHYFSSETVALLSVMLNAALYGPIGPAVLFFTLGKREDPKHQIAAVGVAALFAMVMEGGRLFLGDLRPDFTNVLIAGGSAWAAFRISAMVLGWPWFSLPVEGAHDRHPI